VVQVCLTLRVEVSTGAVGEVPLMVCGLHFALADAELVALTPPIDCLAPLGGSLGRLAPVLPA